MPLNDFPRTARLLEAGRDAGHHLGAQLFIQKDGQVLLDAGWGEAREGVPMTPETLMTWLSCSKPFAAVALARLKEQGLVEWDRPVSDWLPEFGQNGKKPLTVRHLLTHTCGFRSADSVWNSMSPQENLERAFAAPLEPGWVPGETAGYQISASWFVLGALVEKLSGMPYAEYVRQEIFRPLGMESCCFALSPQEYQAVEGRVGFLHNTAAGRKEPHRFWDSEAGYGRCWPGASGHGPMRELAKFYEALGRGGSPLLRPETVAELTARQREGLFDLTFQHKVDWGLGLIVNSIHHGPHVPYGFGPHASPETFGHSGAQSSCSFWDPAHGMSVAWVVNGMPGEPVHRRRARELNAALYEDLGLAAENARQAEQ
ncbi:MAG: serine hydrolase [Verrucomicrobium sp.]|nr:serine hydrolase [Verrucomicrobium sp.]